MKTAKNVPYWVLAAGLLCATACKHEPPPPEPKTAAAADDFRRERAEARAAIAKRLDEMDRELDKMSDSIEKAGKKAKRGSKEAMEKLKVESRDLRARLAKAGDASADSWRAARRDFEDGAEKLGAGIKKAWKEITD